MDDAENYPLLHTESPYPPNIRSAWSAAEFNELIQYKVLEPVLRSRHPILSERLANRHEPDRKREGDAVLPL